MSTRVYVGGLPLSATKDQFRELVVPHGEVVPVSITKEEFTNLSQGFGWSGRPVPIELDRVEAHSHLAPAAIPVWRVGTLAGVMAGRRPAPKSAAAAMSVWCGTLPGVMAGRRPASGLPVQSGSAFLGGKQS